MGVRAQRLPLPEEQELAELMALDGLRVFVFERLHGFRFAPPQRFGPILPGHASVRLLDRHKLRVVFQPGSIILLEGAELVVQLVRGVLGEVLERPVEHGQLPVDDRAVIDVIVRKVGPVGQVRAGDQVLLAQQRRAYQVRIAREGRERLVG